MRGPRWGLGSCNWDFGPILQPLPRLKAPRGEERKEGGGYGAAPLPLQGRNILNGRRAPEPPESPREEGLEHPPGPAASSPPAEPSPPRRDGNLVTCLVGLCRSKVRARRWHEGTAGTAGRVTTPVPSSSSSQKSRVALKARENLLLLAGLSQEAAATCLVRGSALCQLLTGHLCDLYSAVPAGTDPADVLAMDRASWR